MNYISKLVILLKDVIILLDKPGLFSDLRKIFICATQIRSCRLCSYLLINPD